jgi:valyl-tRNA synthetase
MVKPAYQNPIDAQTIQSTKDFFDKLLRLLHPFMPFITEEIWQMLDVRSEGDSIMIAGWNKVNSYNHSVIEAVEEMKEIIAAVRNIRNAKNISPKEPLELKYVGSNVTIGKYAQVIVKMANLKNIEKVRAVESNASSFIVKTTEFYIPLNELVNKEDEISKLTEELNYIKGFLAIVDKKLSNESFTQKASHKVIEVEQKKKGEAEAKIRLIEIQIQNLNRSL